MMGGTERMHVHVCRCHACINLQPIWQALAQEPEVKQREDVYIAKVRSAEDLA
jgi:hypothetical protein